MTDHNDTGATARPWRETGDRILLPDGRQLIGSVITDPAIRWMIVEAVNAYERLTAENAELRRERDEARGQRDELARKLSHLVDELKSAEARADALQKVLERAREAVNAIVLSTHSVSFKADLDAIDAALAKMEVGK